MYNVIEKNEKCKEKNKVKMNCKLEKYMNIITH